MTTDRPDDREDVIEQAAQIIRNAKSYRTPDGIRDRATAASLDLKHAGLLATPADQDNTAEETPLQKMTRRAIKAEHERDMEAGRAERAEAEVERLEESLSLLLWELTGGRASKTNYDVPTMVREIEDYFERTKDNTERDLLRAQVAAVRAASTALLERMDGFGHGKYSIHPDAGACVTCDLMADLRAKLNTAGGDQP